MAEQEEKQEKKEEKPKTTTLDSVIAETNRAGKGLINSAIGTAAIGASTALFGLDGLVTALSFPYGGMVEKRLMQGDESKKQFTSKNFRDESIVGMLLTLPIWFGVEAVKQIPKGFGLENVVTNILGYSVPVSPFIVGGLFLGALNPAITALYYPLDYLIKNKLPSPTLTPNSKVKNILLPEPKDGKYKVIEVIDGDTVKLETGEKFRFLGIDAPEINVRWGPEAKEFNEKTLFRV